MPEAREEIPEQNAARLELAALIPFTATAARLPSLPLDNSHSDFDTESDGDAIERFNRWVGVGV